MTVRTATTDKAPNDAKASATTRMPSDAFESSEIFRTLSRMLSTAFWHFRTQNAIKLLPSIPTTFFPLHNNYDEVCVDCKKMSVVDWPCTSHTLRCSTWDKLDTTLLADLCHKLILEREISRQRILQLRHKLTTPQRLSQLCHSTNAIAAKTAKSHASTSCCSSERLLRPHKPEPEDLRF